MSESSRDGDLFSMQERASSFSAPEAVHEHLDTLVERGRVVRTSRKEVIAALIASCSLDEDGMKSLIMTYRKADATDFTDSAF